MHSFSTRCERFGAQLVVRVCSSYVQLLQLMHHDAFFSEATCTLARLPLPTVWSSDLIVMHFFVAGDGFVTRQGAE